MYHILTQKSSLFYRTKVWSNSIGRFCIPLLKHGGFRTENFGKRIDIAELSRVYGQLNGAETTTETGESAEPVNDSRQNPSMNGNETHQNPSVNGNDSTQIIALLENQVADLKTQLEKADARETALIDEKSKLLDLTDRLQKQNETLMLPPAPEKQQTWWQRLTSK